MSYKKLGDFIQPVNERNTDLKVKRLLGVSVKKVFIPSIANTVGTNMKTYKIVKKHQFTYIADTSRRGEKIGLAMLEDYDIAIVSQAYTVFEITNHNELDPEYLMMWFRRPEFDRYARFKSHGSVREIFDWDEMCEVELPIPNITKQREIVKEYNTVVNRITLNEKLNQKLEETAQALYKHWFVDFEFPNEQGKPYQSSGGEMVYCEELDKDVPVGWEVVDCENIASISAGGDKPKSFSKNQTKVNKVPIFSNSTVKQGLFGFTNKAIVFDKSVTISARGGIGYTALRTEPYCPIVRLIIVRPKGHYLLNYLYHFLSNYPYNDIASAQAQLTIPDVSSFKITLPSMKLLENFQINTRVIYDKLEFNREENNALIKLSDFLLSKMTKVELEKV